MLCDFILVSIRNNIYSRLVQLMMLHIADYWTAEISRAYFDTNLSWNFHVFNVCKEMSYCLRLLKFHSRIFSYHIAKLLIESMVFNVCLGIITYTATSIVIGTFSVVHLLHHLHKFGYITGYYH